MSTFGLRPTAIPALGLSLHGVRSLVLLGASVVVTFYFWLEFAAYAARDFKHWRQSVKVAHRELITALEREQALANEIYRGHSVKDQFVADCTRRKAMYEKSVLGSREYRWVPVIGVGWIAWVEYLAPSIIAFVALVLGLWKIGAFLLTRP